MRVRLAFDHELMRIGEGSMPASPIHQPASEDADPIPLMQRLLDNPLLLLLVGVAIPTLLYTLWGVMEIVFIPLAK
jgi:hypothetical protein